MKKNEQLEIQRHLYYSRHIELVMHIVCDVWILLPTEILNLTAFDSFLNSEHVLNGSAHDCIEQKSMYDCKRHVRYKIKVYLLTF